MHFRIFLAEGYYQFFVFQFWFLSFSCNFRLSCGLTILLSFQITVPLPVIFYNQIVIWFWKFISIGIIMSETNA